MQQGKVVAVCVSPEKGGRKKDVGQGVLVTGSAWKGTVMAAIGIAR
jgi:hypothetical protein